MSEPQLPTRCRFKLDWRGYRKGDVITLKTEAELTTALEIAADGICELGGIDSATEPQTPPESMPETMPETPEPMPETPEEEPPKPKRSRRKTKTDE